MFVVIIMLIAASRPVLKFAEKLMAAVASIGRGSVAAWWCSILTIGPLLGSFITEPAAMTISAMLLGRKFYERRPRATFAYATLGLLFVNVSVGGTLTHFAAPPVLMVAGKWGWGMSHMLVNFGWKAVVGIIAANVLYYAWFRNEFQRLAAIPAANGAAPGQGHDLPVPRWITFVHIYQSPTSIPFPARVTPRIFGSTLLAKAIVSDWVKSSPFFSLPMTAMLIWCSPVATLPV
jgi:hypothetical protein